MSLLRRLFRRLRRRSRNSTQLQFTQMQARLKEQAEKLAMMRRRAQNARRRGISDGILLMVCGSLKPGDVVCDCGANIGSVTELLAATGATVHAFEPDPHAITILRQKFADQPNVVLHPVAVGAKAGQVRFYRTSRLDADPKRAAEGNSIFGGHLVAQEPGAEQIDVPMNDFPAFLADLLDKGAHIPFVKIDVEGAELDILPAMLERGLLDRIGLTAAETHEYQIADRAADFAALRQTIEARYPKHRVNLDWI